MNDSNTFIGKEVFNDSLYRIIERLRQVDEKLDQPETEEINMEIQTELEEISKDINKVFHDDIESQAKKNNVTPKYTVYVDDNFHFMDKDERYTAGVYDTEDEAIAVMKQIVDECILMAFNQDPKTTAEVLFTGYQMGGEDPWCTGANFSAWSYAKELCEKLCEGNTK